MNFLTTLGILLILFGVLVFLSKYVVSKKTRETMEQNVEPIPVFYKSMNKVLIRMIVVLVIMMLILFTYFNK